MNIIILYSENDKIEKYIDIFIKIQIKTTPLLITTNWENDKIFLDTVKSNEYFFVLTSNESFNEKWFKFVIGYCLGKKCSLFLFLIDPDFNIPEHLSFMNYGSNEEDISKFFIEEYKAWEKKNEIEIVKDKITGKGLYFTPYHFFKCIEKNDVESVDLYLKADFSPDTRNEKGATAFNYAVQFGHNEIAFLLMNKNCDIFAVNKDSGNNALMDAAAEGNIEMAQILIEKGIELNIKSKNDQTALMLAVGRNDEEIVELLLKSGADTETKDLLDMSAKKYAEILKYNNILELFKKYEF